MLLDHAKIMPYYFYMCDMIPNAEHWRTSVGGGAGPAVRAAGLHARASRRPRMVCDVPFVGQALGPHADQDYDRVQGHLDLDEELPDRDRVRRPRGAVTREYHYYDPIYTLPEEGQAWWREQIATGCDVRVELRTSPRPDRVAADPFGTLAP